MEDIDNWRFQLYRPDGTFLRTVERDASYVRGSVGMRASLSPWGGCQEMTFAAQGAGLKLLPLHTVRFELLSGGAWVPAFLGEVRMGGNARDLFGERYTLTGMSARFEEVTLPPGPLGEGMTDAATLARLAIAACLPALGSQVRVLEEDFLPLGFTLEVKQTNEQNLQAFLDKIKERAAAPPLGLTLDYGVRPDGRAYLRAKRADMLERPNEAFLDVEPQAPVAEKPVTVVQWLLAKRPDGHHIKHLSRAPEADTYGPRTRTLPLEAGMTGFRADQPTITATVGNLFNPPGNLIDGSGPADHRDSMILIGTGDTGSAEAVVTLTAPAVRLVLAIYLVGTYDGDTSRYVRLDAPDGRTQTLYAPAYGNSNLGGFLGFIQDTLYSGDVPWPAGTTLTIRTEPRPEQPAGQREAQAVLAEIRPERPHAEVLDAAARPHYRLPASDPAKCDLPGFLAPADFRGRLRIPDAQGGPYERDVEVYEYEYGPRGDALGVFVTGIRTGQPDDPYKLAQAVLIAHRDGAATNNALTAQT